MSPFAVLLPAFVVLCASSWMCYQPGIRARWWFLVLVAALGAANGFLWSLAARLSESNRQLYSVSMAWDVCAIVAFNLLPLMVCGVRLTPVATVGFVLVVGGACLVKWGG